jgi:beta-aspartyl-peptidase (threonine type)
MLHQACLKTGTGFALVLALAAMAGLRAFAQPARHHHQDPTNEIRAVLDQQVAAWNRHDLEGFMEGYWKSPELTFFSAGTQRASWEGTIARYRDQYQGEGHEMGHLDFSGLKIEMLSPRAAFVRGHWHLSFTSGEAGGLFTLIFRKLPEGWRIVHDHTSSES